MAIEDCEVYRYLMPDGRCTCPPSPAPTAFIEAKKDIADVVADLVNQNQGLGDYSLWLNRILEWITNLSPKTWP